MDFGNNPTNQPPVSSIIEPPKAPVPELSKQSSGIGKTIAIVILSITTATFAGLFVWKLFDWIDASTNLDTQIKDAVSEAVLESQTQMEAEFAEREKDPNTTFTGPADYGSLSFSYPKTWSLFVAADASNGGEYTAYMNPIEIPPVNSSSSIMALRISIKNQNFDSVIKTYDASLKSGKMTMSVRNINNDTATANVYHGILTSPNGAVGSVAVLRIRDKTAILQSDSDLFSADFEKVLSTLIFNS